MTEIQALHRHGLTRHQTGPVGRAGFGTVEAVAVLVDAHRSDPDCSELSLLPGMGASRVAAVCGAVDGWRAAREGVV